MNKRTIDIMRGSTSDHGTVGHLSLNRLDLFTLELPWRNNQQGISCIPIGTYPARVDISPRHGRVILLSGVPGRSAIEIHAGNWAGDRSKSLASDSLGCILVGKSIANLRNQLALVQSRIALSELLEEAQDSDLLEVNISGSIGILPNQNSAP